MAAAKRRLEAVAQNPLATEILARFGTSEEVTVERLESELAERERYDIVAALRALQKAGAGVWVGGRKGGKSRFVWSRPGAKRGSAEQRPQPVAQRRTPATVAPVSRAAVAAPAPERKPRVEPQPEEAPQLLEHSFHIRKGVLASLRLPADVTRQEIERLCRFLQAIPFR